MMKQLLGALLCLGATQPLYAQATSDLTVTKMAPATVQAGNNLSYILTASSYGPDTASNVELSDPLPLGTTFVSATQLDGPTATLTVPAVGQNGTVTASLPSLAPGGHFSPLHFYTFGNTAYFSANDVGHGRELWKTDGTQAGTKRVKDINPDASSFPDNFFAFNNALYFYADDGTHGYELWKTDGTEDGTVMVKDINPGSGDSYPSFFADVNGAMYFNANDGSSGRELWKTDGTEEGTVQVADINVGSGSSHPGEILSIDGTILFQANDGIHGSELWKTDGTQAGTEMVSDILYISDQGSNPSYLTNLNGVCYFVANDGINGKELWKSDGTTDGTVMVKDIDQMAYSSDPDYIIKVGNSLYFQADDGNNGTELWKSDGTEAGTVLVKDINPGLAGSSPHNWSVMNGTLYFQAYHDSYGYELWKTDGTAEGTVLVKDIESGSGSSTPTSFVTLNNTLYFYARTSIGGYELWKSDGTEAGTVLVKDINPGSEASQLTTITALDDIIVFGTNDGRRGLDLWKSDGSEAGTTPVLPTEVASFEIVVNVGQAAGATISNTASLTSSDNEADPEDNSATADTSVISAPTGLALSPRAVKEKQPAGTFVGTFSTSGTTAGDSVTYTLVTGEGDTDNSQFSIVGASLRTTASFDVAVKDNYTIRVRTTNRGGLFFEQAFTINITESAKPTVAISSPTLGQKVLRANFTGNILSGSASDNVGVSSVKVRLARKRDGANQYWNGISFGATPIYLGASLSAQIESAASPSFTNPGVNWTLDGQLPSSSQLDNGAYTLQVYALDAANNKSDYANVSFTVLSDVVAPTLSIATPTLNQKILITNFNGNAVGGQVNDDQGVTGVKVRLSRKRGTTNTYWNGTDFVTGSTYVNGTVEDNTWSLGASVPPANKLDNGAYQIEAYALDGGGNKSLNSKVGFMLSSDFTAPSVSIATPTSSQVININEFGAGTLTGTASDNIGVASVKLKLQRKRGTTVEYWNGTAFTTTASTFDASYNSVAGTWSYDTAIPASALDAGGYTLYASAFDAAGNKTTSPSRAFAIVGTPSVSDAVSVQGASSAKGS